MYARKTSFDLQKELMHVGVHKSSSTNATPPAKAGRKAKKPLKSIFLLKNEEMIITGKKHKYSIVED